ncbi:MAG: Stf0 family sulfotransferase [Anaerolineaceae bacterium]
MENEEIRLAREGILRIDPSFPFPSKSYLVLSSGRSGSTLLTNYLKSIGYGNPIEAFNPNIKKRNRYGWEINFSDPLAYLRKSIDFQTMNGVMGMKFLPNQFILFLEMARKLLEPPGVELKDEEIPFVFFPNARWVHLERKYKLDQAISLSKALQTGIWYEMEGEDPRYKEYVVPAVYDRAHIESCFDLSLVYDNYWRLFIKKMDLNAHHLFYEDLTSHFSDEVSRLNRYLEIEPTTIAAPTLRKQANQESLRWKERFIQETPWFRDPGFMKAYEVGDMDTLFISRVCFIARNREQELWSRMPANRYKKIRSLSFRFKRRIKGVLKSTAWS